MDPGLSSLLKWSVENSSASAQATTSEPRDAPDAAALNSLLGGPSDADLMRASMAAITSSDDEVPIDDKLVAFDNFEQLIENLDNANNLAPLGLWTPLLASLAHSDLEMRTMAAWCVGTAVQNNLPSQERLVAMNGIPPLARIAVNDDAPKVKRKAVYALSSACRNYQPAMDVLTTELEKLGKPAAKVDAADMEACDGLFNGLKEGLTNA
jgi:hsp70-interacting protein